MSVNTPHPLPPDSPEALHPLLRFLRFARRPLERFFQIEAASGILLLVTAALALGWANSPWASSYQHLWHTPFGFALGAFAVEKTLAWFVNDALMVLFFFVVGLEIRREIHRGELSEWRRAALPVAAALGGMLAPAGLYLLLAGDTETHSGWGVPMATDIAFAVGILMLLGKRVPPALRVLLLAVAVIDDLGAIVVIALFYSSGIQPLGLLVAAAGFGAIVAMQRLGVRSKLLYVLPAVVVWAGIYAAGVHPTIAGVLVGLLTPVLASDGEVPPSESLITTLHPWVAFGIMPVFALANAGVTLSGGSFGPFATNVLNAVAVGLVLGKPLGILSACWLALRLRIGTLPLGLTFRHLLVLGVVAGVGFTMALFIAQLAFVNAELLAAAKLGVLVASACAAVLAFGLGRVLLLPVAVVGAAQSEDEAESSTEK
ncbi:MAG: Na+/H+ antiporter NhaA [Polyangiaceae bacterium]|nr:Na+/H+ antiporter NhaA [Polyangiaceae bacterium]